MNKKKVAVLLPWLKMGGTNKIAINFIKELSQYCDVTLILSQNSGELLSELPKEIKVIIDDMRDFRNILKEDLKKIRLNYVLKDVIYYSKIRLGKDSVDNYRYLVERHSYICNTEFDCAISYHGQSPERLLNLLYRVHSKKKVAWIHGEMSFSDDKCKRLQKYYQKLDHFFFVSNPTKDSFFKAIPLADKESTVYYNPINKEDIIKKSKEPCVPEFSDSYINLLTVGRISSEKGQDMIPVITKKLVDQGYRIRWYVVGDGDMRLKLEQSIQEFQVTKNVILLGVKTNPYCYMKACDIYIQPSYTEGFSTTICEAGILGKAIIGTKPSGGIRDQIDSGKDGMIVDATVSGISEAIEILIKNGDLRKQFEQEICKKNFEGKGEINKFLSFLN